MPSRRRRGVDEDVEIEVLTRPRRDVLVLALLYTHGPLTVQQLLELLRQKYGDNPSYEALLQVLRSLHKYKMVSKTRRSDKKLVFSITERGVKLLRYEGLVE